MARRNQDFQTIRSEGGLLPLDLLRRVLDPRSGLPGTTAEDYGLPAGERLSEAITQSWNRLRKHWTEFREAAADLPAGAAGTGLTNDKWSLPLLRELGFGFLPVTAGPELDGRTYPIGRFFGPVPIHLVGSGLSLDRRAAGQRGAAAANPHGLVQEFLNRSDAHLWAVVSNGLRLRVLRDNQALSRQSFLDFDLETMFAGEVYSDFVLLWLVVHATRFVPRDGDRADTCRLEQWTQEAERLGTRVLGDLRGGVERALAILGAGLTGHSKNQALREALRSGALPPASLHEQLLRVVYRLIFLFVAEDRTLDGRSLLHPPDQSAAARIARERYADHYGTARLRRLAGRIKGSRHGDLWRQFRLLVAPLSGDPGAEATRRHLALPALGSFLWDPVSTAALNDTELTNYDFLETLRRLAYTRQDKMLRPVDYHNLGAEELGGVYESLLALTPQVNGGGGHFSFAEFTGNRRKTSGSYYTPDALVQCLLDSALDPVVEAAVKDKTGAEAEQAILDLKVCDPAVGSGHFLVGAAHRLARHLARIRAHAAGESEPSPLLYQRALRDVIGRCLYGVDVNPMAAELCRVGLWLEALEPGKPLSFLDRHIRVGNSLLGATSELIEGGLPDAAFKPIQGDDKKVCAARRKQNKNERELGHRDMGFIAESGEEYDSLASRSRSIDHGPDDTLEEVHTKEAQFRRLQESADYRDVEQVADAWCAAFVWPKRPGVVDAPTTDTLRRLREGSEALAPAQREEMERIAARYEFFHWHTAFPEVFDAGGFDCVLGNPPWERVKLVEKEWFAERRSEIANAPNAAARKRMIDELQHRLPELHAGYAAALRKSNGTSRLLRDSGRYPFCGRGDINLYAVFAEAMRSIVNERGRAGCVLPTGVATDDTTKLFFQDVVEKRSLVSLFDFENRKGLFPEVDSRMKFCLFTAGSGATPTSERAEFVFFAHAVDELRDSGRRFTLSPDDMALLNPNTRTCPIFRSRRDAELTKAIYRRVPVLVRDARDRRPERDPWSIRFNRMFDMSNDSIIFREREELEANGWNLQGNVFHRDKEECLPLYEAKMVHHFDHRWASFDGAGSEEAADDVPLEDKRNPDFRAMPRYWVEAREVYLRSADLPKGLLTGLRSRDYSMIVLGVAHLLFAHRLRQTFRDQGRGSQGLFAEWVRFVEDYPFARGLKPTQMGLCGNNPGVMPANWMELAAGSRHERSTPRFLARIAPGPDYLPAAPLDDVDTGPQNITAWYAVDEAAVSGTLEFAARYRHLFEPMPRLRNEDDAHTCAEEWLQQTTPRWLIGIRNVTNTTNERTAVGGVLPLSAVGNSLPVWASSSDATIMLPPLLSSYVCDFLTRLKMGGVNFNFFIAKQIPVLHPDVFDEPVPWGTSGKSMRDWLLPRVLELTYTTWDLEPFAGDCGWTGPPFRWDEERRFLLRCELEAAFFHLYLPANDRGDWQSPRQENGTGHDEAPEHLAELTRHFPTPRDAVDYIVETFPIVRRKDETRYGEYRTKRVILDLYDAMLTGIATGEPYRTVVNPPPADPSCCHPPRIAVLDLASLADGEWARPQADQAGAETAVLAAVLKAAVGPAPIPTVRLTVVLAMEPRLLTPSLSSEEASDWRRLVGPEATALESATVPPRASANVEWGRAVRQLRGTGLLIENLAAGTWAPGSGLGAIQTEGWPDGRVGMVMEVLRRRNAEKIIRALPATVRDWINAEAA